MIRVQQHAPTMGALAALASLLVLAGCSSGGGADAASADELTYEDSPLSEYLGEGEGAVDDYAALEVEVQEAIAACMAEEGFEYVPVQLDVEDMVVDVEDMDTEEWVAQHGYGFSSSSEPVDETEMPVDPNAAYLESLSASEQEAYDETLYGPSPSADEMSEDGSYEYDWQTAGCQGSADHEIRGDMLGTDGEHEALFEAMTALYDDLLSDPAMVEVDAAWSECMAEAGHADLPDPNAAVDRAIEASDAIWADGTTEPSDEDLAAARDEEIELALADFRCKEDTDYQQRQLAVQFALEEQFVEDHREELEAFRASVEQGR